MAITDGEKLIITMLADLHESLKVNGSVDAAFVRQHIDSDFWAIKREYSGIFGDGEREEADIAFVQNALDMWRIIEASYENLTEDEQVLVRAAKGSFGTAPRFGGFDGHTEYPTIARTLIVSLRGWDEFKDRPMDSHSPDTAVHARMVEAYKGLRAKNQGRLFPVDDVIAVIDAQIHPTRR